MCFQSVRNVVLWYRQVQHFLEGMGLLRHSWERKIFRLEWHRWPKHNQPSDIMASTPVLSFFLLSSHLIQDASLTHQIRK